MKENSVVLFFFPQMVTIVTGLGEPFTQKKVSSHEMATQWLEQAGCGHPEPKPGQDGDMAPKATSSV